MNNVLILLVAHPTKMRKQENGQYDVPTLYDVSGSADFRNQTHDGFTIHRYFGNEVENPYTCFINTKTKFQFQGNIGATINFQYDVDNGRYYAQGSHPDKSDWTEVYKEEQKSLVPNFDFDEIVDDLPF
jgi:twinkle protein